MNKDKTILIVDDEAELRQMVQGIFARAGYGQVLTAGTGAEALALCRQAMPDLVILDVVLPDIDGFEKDQEVGLVYSGQNCIRIDTVLTGIDKSYFLVLFKKSHLKFRFFRQPFIIIIQKCNEFPCRCFYPSISGIIPIMPGMIRNQPNSLIFFSKTFHDLFCIICRPV